MGQLSFYPQALGMASAVMGVVAVLPGMPTLVFAGLSGWHRRARLVRLQAQGRRARRRNWRSEDQGTHRRRAQGRADLHRAGARSAAHRTGLRPAAPDQRRAGPPHHRPDQGAAPPAGAGDGLRHAGGAHPRQHAARRQRISHPHQGSRIRHAANCSPVTCLIMDPKGLPIDLPGTHTTEPAFGLPATWVSQSAARGSLVPRLHRGRSGHGADHPSDRSAQEPHGRASLLCGDQEAARRSAAGDTRSWWTNSSPRRSRSPACSACCRPCWPSASRSATCPPSWKASPRRWATPRTRFTSPSMCARGWRASSAIANLSPGGYLPLIALSPAWEQAFAESIVGQGEERQLAMAPSQLQQFIQTVRERFDDAGQQGRSAGAADQSAGPALRALHHRALPAADGGDEPERNPRLGAAAHTGAGLNAPENFLRQEHE